MLFIWLFSFASVLFLTSLSFSFTLHENSYLYLVAFGLISALPVFLPVIDFLKKDEKKSANIFTKVWILWMIFILIIIAFFYFYLQFSFLTTLFFLFFSFFLFFWKDARWFFLVSLYSFFLVIIALLINNSVSAEELILCAVLFAIAGVIIEIFSPLMKKIHWKSRELFLNSEKFVWEYTKEMKNYFYFFAVLMWCLEIFLLFVQGKMITVAIWSYIYMSLLTIWLYIVWVLCDESKNISHNFFSNLFPFFSEKYSKKHYKNLIILLSVLASWLSVFAFNDVYSIYFAIFCIIIITLILIYSVFIFSKIFAYDWK